MRLAQINNGGSTQSLWTLLLRSVIRRALGFQRYRLVPCVEPLVPHQSARQSPRLQSDAIALLRSRCLTTAWRIRHRRRAALFLVGVEHLLAAVSELGVLLVQAGDDAAAAGGDGRAVFLVVCLARRPLLFGQSLGDSGLRQADQGSDQNGVSEL